MKPVRCLSVIMPYPTKIKDKILRKTRQGLDIYNRTVGCLKYYIGKIVSVVIAILRARDKGLSFTVENQPN